MRPKSTEARSTWPENLNSRKKSKGDYFSWKDPRTGKEYGLGYSEPVAILNAREANLSIRGDISTKPSLSDRIQGVQIRKKWERDIFVRRSFAKITGVYLLFSGEEVVYVGQSTNIMRRIAQHFDDGKVFDQYSYTECQKDKLDSIERKYISHFSPKYNIMHNNRGQSVVIELLEESN